MFLSRDKFIFPLKINLYLFYFIPVIISSNLNNLLFILPSFITDNHCQTVNPFPEVYCATGNHYTTYASRILKRLHLITYVFPESVKIIFFFDIILRNPLFCRHTGYSVLALMNNAQPLCTLDNIYKLVHVICISSKK